MTITMLFMWLAYVPPKHIDLPLMIAPQAVAPLNLWEDQHSVTDVKKLYHTVKESI